MYKMNIVQCLGLEMNGSVWESHNNNNNNDKNSQKAENQKRLISKLNSSFTSNNIYIAHIWSLIK